MSTRREFLAAVAASSAAARLSTASDGVVDLLPPGVLRRLGSPRFRHATAIEDVWISPQAKTILVETETALVVWDATGRQIANLPKWYAKLRGLVFPDTTTALVLTDTDEHATCLLTAIDLITGRVGTHLSTVVPTDCDVALFPDGAHVVRLVENQIRVETLPAGRLLWSRTFTQEVDQLPKISPDGRWIGVAVENRLLVVHAASGLDVRSLTLSPINANNNSAQFGFFPDGSRIVVGSIGATIYPIVGGPAVSLPDVVVEDPVIASPDGRSLVARSTQGGWGVWDVATAKLRRSLPLPASIGPLFAASRDGRLAVTIPSSFTLGFVDLTTGRELPQSADPPVVVTELQFTPSGRLLGDISPSNDTHRWISWETHSGAGRKLQPKDPGWKVCAVSSDEKWLACESTADEINGYELRAMATGSLGKRLSLPREQDASCVTFAGRGARFVAATKDSIHIWEVGSGRRRTVGTGPPLTATLIAAAANGNRAAVGWTEPNAPTGTDHITVIDLAAARIIDRFTLPDLDANTLAFTPDGGRLVVLAGVLAEDPQTPDTHNLILVRECPTATDVHRLLVPIDPASEESWVAISPDGRAVATAMDGAAVVWEVASGRPRARFPVAGRAAGGAFRADGRTLAVSTPDAPIYLWDLHANRAAAEPNGLMAMLGHRDATVAYAAIGGLIRMLDGAVARLGATLPPTPAGDPAAIRALAIQLAAPDYRTRATADRALRAMADRARPVLAELAQTALDLESQARLQAILTAPLTASQIRAIRAVEVLDGIGTPAAVALLRRWATGAPGATLTTEAISTLRRLRAE